VLSGLGTIAAVYRVQRFEVPRPRALLGEEHLYTLLAQIRSVIASHRQDAFRSFRISAAGVTSAVFQRLSEELARRTGLRLDPEDGDLLIRVRRAPPPAGRSSGAAEPAFEALLRLTPRPLSVRAWRVANLPGALNATVARVMAELTSPAPHDRFLNLTCGSGTLMIERLELGPARLIVGGDQDPAALDSARRNLEAAGFQTRASLVRWDAGHLPLPDGVMTALCADLPFGMLVGSRRENERLYPQLLAEATRVAAPGAAMVLITHAIPLLQKSLVPHRLHWSIERSYEVQLSYQSGVIRPQVFLLRRSRRH
jgi:23S rRNA G2445 N2-methylase RlmL